MQKLILVIFLFISSIFLFSCSENSKEKNSTNEDTQESKIALVIHGGAGTIRKENMTEEREKAYRDKLQEALDAGFAILEEGGESIDAIIAAIDVMERSPLFNAGIGAVFTNDGKNELDASIMQGIDQDAGAVAGVTRVKSPILAARAVMEKSPHVMMAGAGAEKFAEEVGLELVDPSYFFNETRFQQLEKIKDTEKQQLDHSASHYEEDGQLKPTSALPFEDHKFGTVGAVAVDKKGNIVAGTSTGGMTNKKYGRIGDAPIIGAGTYADNASCGVSATGHGEYFIRAVVAYDIAAEMKYQNKSLKEAAENVVNNKLVEFEGSGGVIALDRYGNVSMPFNTSGMYRGYKREGEKPVIKIYADED